MAEDAGKKKFIKNFLNRIKAGEGLIDDILIERVVRPPGSMGEGSTAKSLSGKTINTITELLEDDLKRSFDDGYFTFRFVAAVVGSGKTSLLTYLEELTKTKPTHKELSIVNRFQLSDLLSTDKKDKCFSVKLYSHILAQTFWELLNSENNSIKDTAKGILNEYLEQNEVIQLVNIKKFMPFRSKFIAYLSKVDIVFEMFFFEVIDEISKIAPMFTFCYLIDELDSLQNFPEELQETRSLIKGLIKRVSEKFESKIRLLIYLVGTSDNVGKFISEDSVVESLVGHQVINLSKGSENEFEQIRAKIDARIEGAFKGYKYFANAWNEIENIRLDPAHKTLRLFCQDYAMAVLKIHEKYFEEEPEKSFEGNARELIEAQCRDEWKTYLTQKSYDLSSVSTTTILEGHAFDCYVELLHNGSAIARCFGEAKNYDLLSSHLEIFKKWLEDVNFRPSITIGTLSDIAFMIAPSCPSLLQRKLELKSIKFIQSPKVIAPEIDSDKIDTSLSISINTGKKTSIKVALKGTSIKETTIDKILVRRQNKIYESLDEFCSDLKLTDKVKSKLKQKFEDKVICFS
jgi:hypothetical protein